MTMQDNNKRIVVLGAGESGTGAAILAKDKGFDVFLSDSGTIAARYREVLEKENIAFEEGGHSTARILSASEIIKSPGIPCDAPIVLQAVAKGIPVVSEIGFAGRYTDSKMVCITG